MKRRDFLKGIPVVALLPAAASVTGENAEAAGAQSLGVIAEHTPPTSHAPTIWSNSTTANRARTPSPGFPRFVASFQSPRNASTDPGVPSSSM